MRYSTFAAIYIGTYDVTMEVFEVSRTYGIRSIDQMRKHLEIATDTYATGRVGEENIRQLIEVLKSFMQSASEYQVESVRALAGSAIRDAENSVFLVGQIKEETGLNVELLSNSEQRYLSFKAIVSSDPKVAKLMEKGTAVIDVGGGSIQVSLFEAGRLETTLNLRIGSLRVRDCLMPMHPGIRTYARLVEEFINHEMNTFRKVHLKGRKFESVVVNGDFITESLIRLIEDGNTHSISRKRFDSWYKLIQEFSDDDLARKLNVPSEFISILRPTAVIYHHFVDELGAQKLYVSNVSIAWGIAYDYGEKTKKLKSAHSFADDILGAAQALASRYCVEQKHTENVLQCAIPIFNAMKKRFGLASRDRLLLQIAALLHEVGKYISLNNNGDCAYQIIMNNEIIGLSHDERKMIAMIVKHNTVWLPDFETFARETGYSTKKYLRVAQLTAILRLANEFDRSHHQKVRELRVRLTDQELKVRAFVDQPFVLEQNLIAKQARFFQYVFNISVDLRVKRIGA